MWGKAPKTRVAMARYALAGVHCFYTRYIL